MKWLLKQIEQETDHRFLNFYTFHYEVKQGDEVLDYPYFVASRNKEDHLVAKKKDYSRPDGVLIAAIKEEEKPSVLIIEEFRPALNAMIVAFPAGLMDPTDHDEAETARREAEEEAGVILDEVKLLCPASPTSAGLSDELVAVVEGKIKGLTHTHLEKFEDINARFVEIEKLPKLLADPSRIIALNVRLCMLYLVERYGKER